MGPLVEKLERRLLHRVKWVGWQSFRLGGIGMTNIGTEEFKGKKKGWVSFFVVLFILFLGIGIGTLVTYRAGAGAPADSQLKIQTDGKPLVGGAILALSQAFEEVTKRVGPAVVNINTEEVVRLSGRGGRAPGGAPGDDPMNDFFHRFLPGQNMPERFTRRSLGSGVLVDPKGYIVTNNHVVQGATKIKVNVLGAEEYTARVIATDPLSDIAVIKIDGTKDFSYAKVGDSKAMKVGDWVIAVGSPFGLEQTVTAGIISATGRTFEAGAQTMLYSDYLQTDAAINPGNSGGPLVNMNGEVVGINSFIQTESSSNAGVGFAVPSHIFVKSYNQILDRGKVQRGWLGVSMNAQSFTPVMAKYFGVKQGSGVLITGLIDEKGNPSSAGPAAKAGLKAEDVVVEFDGKRVNNMQEMRIAVANTPAGQTLPVKVIRFGAEKTLTVTLAERATEAEEKGNYSFEEKEEEPKPEIGLSFDNVPARMAQDLNISGGALILSVKAGSLAEEAGLSGQDSPAGADIIVAANGKKIDSAQDLLNVVKNLKVGEGVVLKALHVSRTANGGVTSTAMYTSITKP
jgi:serine protease Do